VITHGCMATFTSCVNNNMCCIRLVVNHSEISNSKYSCLMTLEINFEIIIQLFLKLLDDISSSSVFSAPQQNIYWIYSVYSRYLKKKLSLMWLWLRKLNSPPFHSLAAIYTQTLAFKYTCNDWSPLSNLREKWSLDIVQMTEGEMYKTTEERS
jgi:hypothetical protein